MKKKMMILGIGNSKKLNYIIVKKENGFLEWLDKLLQEGYDMNATGVKFYRPVKMGGPAISKRVIRRMIDEHEVYINENKIRVDVFYGQSKVFITYYADNKRRHKVNKKLEEISEFLKWKNK